MIERQHVEQLHAFAPGHDERTQRDAEDRHDHRHKEPENDSGKGNPAPAMQGERLRLQALAAHRDIALRLAQQHALHEHQRCGDRDDRNHDHGHQLI